MTPKDSIKYTIGMSQMIVDAYVGDLDDADLMVRPVPGMNHVAWQLGHLITSENNMMSNVGVAMPPLPDGFAEAHTRETATSDDASKFFKKAQYLDALKTQRAATLAAVEKATDADLAKKTPESMQMYAKTVADAYNMIGVHVLMHVGQWVAVRRAKGKPVTI